MKPGYKTTEFIVSVLTALGALLASLVGELSPKYAALASAISLGAYSVSRGLAKMYPPKPGP